MHGGYIDIGGTFLLNVKSVELKLLIVKLKDIMVKLIKAPIWLFIDCFNEESSWLSIS